MIEIPVSIGEILDKISVLVIKLSKIHDESKRVNINKELDLLSDIWKKHMGKYPMHMLVHEQTVLFEVNKEIWELLDRVNLCIKYNSYSGDFVHLTREIYKLNERRAEIKREINRVTGSEIVEEKNYSAK